MRSPLVSVIIAVRNEEKNIARLIESIKKQTYKNVEIVVVDDQSSDQTPEIAKKSGAKVFKRKHGERSIQRNFGAEHSKGDFLLFLDGDMELTENVIRDALEVLQKKEFKLLVVPEKTVGENFIAQVRNFEREMYMGDFSVEVARMFDREVFKEFNGYDPNLTGPEDYDLPYRISKKYKIGRSNEYILHHEENASLSKLLKRKFYYARKGALYAKKHSELILTQGNLIFRKAYFKNWRKFVKNPVLGLSFVFVRVLEQIWAIAGYLRAQI